VLVVVRFDPDPVLAVALPVVCVLVPWSAEAAVSCCGAADSFTFGFGVALRVVAAWVWVT